MKVRSKRTFLKSADGGKREFFEKGKVYDMTDAEFHKYKVYGLYPVKEEAKEEAKK
jgi:hypothetical protein